jgi:hypothetical protein
MSMLHIKGTRGWMRVLVIVMVSLSLTLSMPAKPAMAAGIPVFDGASLASLGKQLVEQALTRLIARGIQFATQEVAKAIGDPVLAEAVLGALDPKIKEWTEKLQGMTQRGVGDVFSGIMRSPEQKFQDCMYSTACTSSIQISNLTAGFKGNDYSNAFNVASPTALPADLKTAFSASWGSTPLITPVKLDFAGPAVTTATPNVYQATLKNGVDINFAYSSAANSIGGSVPPLSLPRGSYFTTAATNLNLPDLYSSASKVELGFGNSAALKVSIPMINNNGATTVGNPDLKVSPSVAQQMITSFAAGTPYTIPGTNLTIKPGEVNVSPNGTLSANGTGVSWGPASFQFGSDGQLNGSLGPVTATITANGQPAVQVSDLGKALCLPNDRVCNAVGGGVGNILNCVIGGAGGNCAENAGKSALGPLLKALFGGIGNNIGMKADGVNASSALDAETLRQQLMARFYCKESDNQCVTIVTNERNKFNVNQQLALFTTAEKIRSTMPSDYDEAYRTVAEMQRSCKSTVTCSLAQLVYLKQFELSQGLKGNMLRILKIQADVASRLPLHPTSVQ